MGKILQNVTYVAMIICFLIVACSSGYGVYQRVKYIEESQYACNVVHSINDTFKLEDSIKADEYGNAILVIEDTAFHLLDEKGNLVMYEGTHKE